jgi:hypothetical protein
MTSSGRDPLATDTLTDLLGDLLAAIGKLVERASSTQLRLRAAAPGLALGRRVRADVLP